MCAGHEKAYELTLDALVDGTRGAGAGCPSGLAGRARTPCAPRVHEDVRHRSPGNLRRRATECAPYLRKRRLWCCSPARCGGVGGCGGAAVAQAPARALQGCHHPGLLLGAAARDQPPRQHPLQPAETRRRGEHRGHAPRCPPRHQRIPRAGVHGLRPLQGARSGGLFPRHPSRPGAGEATGRYHRHHGRGAAAGRLPQQHYTVKEPGNAGPTSATATNSTAPGTCSRPPSRITRPPARPRS